MKPLLKWAGGKRHIAEQLEALFPVDWRKGMFYEPFIGGAAMFLHCNPQHAVIADINPRLISFYRHVQEAPNLLVEKIITLKRAFDRKKSLEEKKICFLSLRKKYNESAVDSLESSALLYAINKLCFNGLYRENAKGQFNVPFGARKKFPEIDVDDFFELSRLLEKVQILNSDFTDSIAGATRGDFIYFDPPYIPIDLTSSFTSYSADGFSLDDQRRLSSTLINLKEKGIRAMCSNSDTPVTREIFNGLNIKTIQAPRMVSATAAGRGTVSELVITNYSS